MTGEDFKQRVIECSKDAIIQDVDGFFYFHPRTDRGFYGSESLRVIADELDSLNKPWNDEIDELCRDQPDSDTQALPTHMDSGQEPF